LNSKVVFFTCKSAVFRVIDQLCHAKSGCAIEGIDVYINCFGGICLVLIALRVGLSGSIDFVITCRYTGGKEGEDGEGARIKARIFFMVIIPFFIIYFLIPKVIDMLSAYRWGRAG
jgi:hypothetical protein